MFPPHGEKLRFRGESPSSATGTVSKFILLPEQCRILSAYPPAAEKNNTPDDDSDYNRYSRNHIDRDTR